MTDSPPKTWVTDLRSGALVNAPFLAISKTTRRGKRGTYLSVTLADRTGSVEARVWDRADAISAAFQARDFVMVRGEVVTFEGQLQLSVFDVRALDPTTLHLPDFMPASRWAPQALLEQLRALVEAHVSSAPIRALLLNILQSPELQPKLLLSPAATRNHHAYLSGLIEHILSMSRLAVLLSNHYHAYYPNLLDPSLLIAGCVLHDLAKTQELAFARGFSYTDEGNLLGHLVMGIDIVSAFTAQIPDFPPDLTLRLKHLVASHHEKLEYGSPKVPQTVEAIILHHIDNLDAKVNQLHGVIDRHLSAAQGDPTPWTERIPSLERALYIGPPQQPWRAPLPLHPSLRGPGLPSDEPAPERASRGAAQPPRVQQLPLWPPAGLEPSPPPPLPDDLFLHYEPAPEDLVDPEDIPPDVDLSEIWPLLPPPTPAPAPSPALTAEEDAEPEPGSAAADLDAAGAASQGLDLFSFPLRRRR
jgi:3'-5' exoribonuclease